MTPNITIKSLKKQLLKLPKGIFNHTVPSYERIKTITNVIISYLDYKSYNIVMLKRKT